MLMEARPNYGCLGEEESSRSRARTRPRRWVVRSAGRDDQLSSRPAALGVSIAPSSTRARVVAGVVYDPPAQGRDVLRREGARGGLDDDQRLRVSDRSRMVEALFRDGPSLCDNPDLPETLRDLARLLPQTAGVRRWGAAALESCLCRGGPVRGLLGGAGSAPGTRRRAFSSCARQAASSRRSRRAETPSRRAACSRPMRRSSTPSPGCCGSK